MFQISFRWLTLNEAKAYLREKRWESASIDAVLATMVKMGPNYFQPVEL